MNDSKLGAAVRSVCRPDLERLCSLEEGACYEFSEEFESRMQDIFKPKKRISIRRRIRTGLLIAAIFAAGFCLGMTNKQLWNYSAERSEGGRMLTFNIDSVEDRKKHLEEVYTLSGMPGEYQRVIYENTSYSSVQIWMDKPDNGSAVFFDQCVAAAYKDAFYPDGAEITMTEENGIQYMISTLPGEDYHAIVWYQHGYVFMISGGLSPDQLLSLSRSITLEATQQFG